MRILINGLILSDHNTGLGVFTYHILNHIYQYFDSHQISYDVLCQNKLFLPLAIQQHAIEKPCRNFLDRNLSWEKYACDDKYDLIWSTTQHGSIRSHNKQIITIHDLMPIKYPQGRYHQFLYYKMILPKIVKRSSAVITVSENSKKDIINTFRVKDDSKIKVIYSGYESSSFQYDSNILGRMKEKADNYYVILGIHYPYKNIQSVIDAYAKYPKLHQHKVYIIGNDKVKYADELKKKIHHLNLSSSFVFTGFLTDSEKNSLIKNAIALIYPSLYEGFGLPVLESLAIGTPVVCSQTSSLPEVGGKAALYFNPMNIDDIADKIMQITLDNRLRKELMSHRDEQISKFSWEKPAETMFCEINNLLKL